MRVTKSLQVQAYEHLKAMILNGELSYDTIYSETKMAQSLGISRTPMRDAIQYLLQEKYIDIIPNKGFCLHKMTMKDYIETTQLRNAIEGYCAKELARDYRSEKAIKTFEKLRKNLKEQQALISGDINIFFEKDILFHKILVDYQKNTEFSNIFNNYAYRVRTSALATLQQEGRVEETYKEHLHILTYLEQGNEMIAYNNTVYHLNKSRDILKEIYK